LIEGINLEYTVGHCSALRAVQEMVHGSRYYKALESVSIV